MKGLVGGVVTALIIIVLLVGGISCIVKIPVGYEGVQYSISGGVEDKTLTQGWHIVSPTIKVKEFTISNEQLVLTKDSREGSEEDESFKVATSDDASISIDFQMSYRFIPEKLINTYKKFKGMDGNDIVQNRVRTVLKSKVSEVTTNYSLMDIYSGNRKQINDELTDYLWPIVRQTKILKRLSKQEYKHSSPRHRRKPNRMQSKLRLRPRLFKLRKKLKLKLPKQKRKQRRIELFQNLSPKTLFV